MIKKVAFCNKCGSSNLDDECWCYNCNDSCEVIYKKVIEVEEVRKAIEKDKRYCRLIGMGKQEQWIIKIDDLLKELGIEGEKA